MNDDHSALLAVLKDTVLETAPIIFKNAIACVGIALLIFFSNAVKGTETVTKAYETSQPLLQEPTTDLGIISSILKLLGIGVTEDTIP